MKIVLIGAGNVATHLGPALLKSGHKIIQVYSPTKSSAALLARKLKCDYVTDPSGITSKGTVYIIAIRDEKIPEFLDTFIYKDALIVHTSGSVPLSVFSGRFPSYGVFYPLQTFSKSRKVNFKNIPICIEASDPATLKKIRSLAGSISRHIHNLNSEQRMILHLAAVFANNFSNHMYAVAEDLLERHQLDVSLLRPLILETAHKVQRHSPREMQTGPAKRGDASIIGKHIELLKKFPGYSDIYRLITSSIENLNGPML